MSIETKGYSRKPFHVDAVQITAENMEEVAAWCLGEIRTGKKVIRDDDNKIVDRTEVSFIKVDVHRPLNDRQTKGHLGDWVLLSSAGFKVYTERAFEKAFSTENADSVLFNEPTAVLLNEVFADGQLALDVPEITLTLEGSKA